MGTPHVSLNGITAEFLTAYPAFDLLDDVLLLSVGHEFFEVGEGDPADLASSRFLRMSRLAMLVVFCNVREYCKTQIAVPRSTNRSCFVCGSVAFHVFLWYLLKAVPALQQSFVHKIVQIGFFVNVETRMLLRFSQDSPVGFLAESTSCVFRGTVVRLGVKLATMVTKESFVQGTRVLFEFI